MALEVSLDQNNEKCLPSKLPQLEKPNLSFSDKKKLFYEYNPHF